MRYPYYAIVSFGPAGGRVRAYYRSLEAARADRRKLSGASVRIVGCQTRKQALGADIADLLPVVAS